MTVFANVSRLLVGGIFLAAAWGKLQQHPRIEQVAIQAYRLVPPATARILAVVLPPIEGVLALLILTGSFTNYAAAVAGVMLCGFTLGLVSVLRRGLAADCGCFGALRADLVSWKLVVRNVFLICCAATLTWTGGGRLAADQSVLLARAVLLAGVAAGVFLAWRRHCLLYATHDA